MKLVKDNEKGKVFETKEFKVFYRKQDSISGDNDINSYEKIYLISGEAEVSLENDIQLYSSPSEFEFPKKTYHKITAITDIVFIVKN